MKKILILFCCFLIVCGCENKSIKPQTNLRDESKEQLEVITDFIRIRTSPDITSTEVGQVYKGEIYTILSAKQSDTSDIVIWYEIETTTGVRGYIINRYDSVEYIKLLQDIYKEPQTNLRDESKEQLEIIHEFIRIREFDDLGAKEVGQVYKGEIYTILSSSNSTIWKDTIWYEIETTTGIRGFIINRYDSTEYIKLLDTKEEDKNDDKLEVKPVKVKVKGINLDKENLDLNIGENYTLNAKITPNNATNKKVKWSSSNTSVATISGDGKLTAISGGATIITATTDDGEYTATCSVNVKNVINNDEGNVKVTSVLINPMPFLEITKEETQQFEASIFPYNATNKNLKWSSSNTSVAEISENGKLTAISGGVTVVTVTTEDGQHTSTCEVTVISHTTGISLNKKSLSINKGENYTLKATIEPTDATNKTIKWSSSDTNIVKVDNSGKITAVGIGSATVTATTEDGKYTDTCEVITNKAPLKVDAGIGMSYMCVSSGCGNYTYVYINAVGGSEKYTYSYKVYKDDVLLGTYTESEKYFTYAKGVYKVDYIVTDSDGESKSGVSTFTIN